jgi:hypothetical protein
LTKRAVAIGAAVIGLVLGAASVASAEAPDRGNHKAIWEFPQHDEGLESGSEWGEYVADVTPEYVNPNSDCENPDFEESCGPGISPGVHYQKHNGPDNADPENAPGHNKE